MIGLVNAAGTSDLARVQGAEQATRDAFGFFIPIERSEDAVLFDRLRSAIERQDFSEVGEERDAESGAEFDRLARGETGARDPTKHLGRFVDVTA